MHAAYMMCTSSDTLAATSVCSCSQLQDLASQNTAKRTASIAACILRLCDVGRGMVASAGVGSCVWGSKGVFDSMVLFSASDESMSAYYVCLCSAAGSPADSCA